MYLVPILPVWLTEHRCILKCNLKKKQKTTDCMIIISYLLFKNVSTFLNNNNYKKQEVLAPDTRCLMVTSWGIIRQSGHMTCAFFFLMYTVFKKKKKKIPSLHFDFQAMYTWSGWRQVWRKDSGKSVRGSLLSGRETCYNTCLETVALTKSQEAKVEVAELAGLEMSTSQGRLKVREARLK